MKKSFLMILSLSALFTAPLLFGTGFVANAGDVYDYAAPFRAWSSLEILRGRIPLWNPWIFAGTPFVASPQSALFYPLTGVFGFLPLAAAFRVFTVFHLLLMAWGFWLWTRARGATTAGAVAGAVLGTFSCFFLSKVTAGHLIHLSGYTWTPFLLLLGEALKRNPTHRFWPWAWAGVSALQFFSGHLQVWVVSHGVLMVLLLDRKLFSWPQVKAWATAVGAFSFGVAVQALPTAAFLPRTTRTINAFLTPQDQYAFATSYSLTWGHLARGWLAPWSWGRPPAMGRLFPEPFSIYLETAAVFSGWVGLSAALVGLALLWRRRQKRFSLLTLGALALGLGKNGPFYPVFWKSLSWLRVPARFYLGIHIALVAGIARAWSALSGRVRWVLLVVLVVELWVVGGGFLRTEDPGARLARTTLVAWLQEQIEDGGGRYMTTQSVGSHNKGMIFGLSNVNGYEALVPAHLWGALAQSQPGVVQPTTGMEMEVVPEKLLTALGVRYVLATSALRSSWPVVWRGGPLEVRENPLFDGLVRGEEGVVLSALRVRPDRLLCRWHATSSWVRVDWAESWFPGWRAWTRAGEVPVRALGGLLQRVEFSPQVAEGGLWWLYRPATFFWGLVLTLVGGLAGGVCVCRGLAKAPQG